MSKYAFPQWLLHNSHTSFKLIKIKFQLPFILLPFLYTLYTFITSFRLHLFSSSASQFSTFCLYPFSRLCVSCRPLSSVIVSLSKSSVTFLTPHYVSFVFFYPPTCATRRQNITWENEGEHKAAVCSLPVNPVMIYVHSVSLPCHPPRVTRAGALLYHLLYR